MRKVLILLVAAAMLTSCGLMAPVNKLYYWGGEYNGVTEYERLAYKDYKTQSPEAVCRLICVYEDMVNHPGGTRQVPPPGICAEYGYLLIQPSTSSIFAEKATADQKALFDSADFEATFNEKAKEMFQKEMEYYPESVKFIGPLLKKLAQ